MCKSTVMSSLNAIAEILSVEILLLQYQKENNEKMTIATSRSVCCTDGTIHELAQVSDEVHPCSVCS